MADTQNPPFELLYAFRIHYSRFLQTVQSLPSNPSSWDAVTLARLGDDLDEYTQQVQQVLDLLYSADFSSSKLQIPLELSNF